MADPDCTVSQFFKDGWWDIERLSEVLSEEMVQQIINFPAGFSGGRADAKIWKCNPNGVFTVKTAYELLVHDEQRGMSGAIGAGGLIRDSVGTWHCGFVVNLGQGQILEAELWGFFFGLKLAIGKGVKKLLV
ncbi:PREDICTED: Heat shock 70 kDa [Prunus dulcis]|uniref:PREDICTED: Heat shock 70 kDa n=1 Tax=Prunus dulcis TaxID=3755 RepID=A0A5E4FPL2_PRUDU|nr:hypothetical protein L3X38_036925 [Prunus dulcis]VVA29422.1 PREDICTED: Heat shock 70 kDa [Prunus dulcis]